jgi:hypothetical protein
MNGNFYRWDGTKIPSHAKTQYEERLDGLLEIARMRNRVSRDNRKPEIDEWPTVGEPFMWHPDNAAGNDGRHSPSRAKPHRTSAKTLIFCLLILAGAGIASALFAPEAASFVVGELRGDGGDIAERIAGRLGPERRLPDPEP